MFSNFNGQSPMSVVVLRNIRVTLPEITVMRLRSRWSLIKLTSKWGLVLTAVTLGIGMMTSSNGNIFWHDDVIKWKHFPRYWPFYEGNSPVTGEIPSQSPVTQSFDVFFDLRLNKWLSKQSKHRWFEMPPRSLWHHCNGERPKMWTYVVGVYNMVCSALFLQRALYTVHCTI